MMGFFSKKLNYPELESGNPVANQVHEFDGPLQDLMGQVSDTLEVIPADDHAYVFIGKPPKKFGVAMIEDGAVQSFIAAAKEKGLDQAKIQMLNEQLRDAYMHNMDAQRYKTSVAGKEVVVTPCPQLDQEVKQIMSSMSS
ncbi:MAG: hypothetical protein GQ530_00970 [Desulfuromonadales bacterium]|nr:hypothetical protein [Desulfuromonadales bacterium]